MKMVCDTHCSIFIAAFKGEVAEGYVKDPFQFFLSSPCSNAFQRPCIALILTTQLKSQLEIAYLIIQINQNNQ